VTTSFLASAWTDNTSERPRIQVRLIELGVQVEANTVLTALTDDEAVLACVFTGRERRMAADHVVMVTARESHDALYRELEDRIEIVRIGDCLAPGTIAACVRSGHEYAQDMDSEIRRDMPFRRETPIRADERD
jgi:dimethylamine/trimethylamine dehydrogenase